jgi:hypothetical protein
MGGLDQAEGASTRACERAHAHASARVHTGYNIIARPAHRWLRAQVFDAAGSADAIQRALDAADYDSAPPEGPTSDRGDH